MKATRRNPAAILVRARPSIRHLVRLPVALLSFGTLSLGLLGLGAWGVFSGPVEVVMILSQTASAGAALGMIYRWVRSKRLQPAYVRIRA